MLKQNNLMYTFGIFRTYVNLIVAKYIIHGGKNMLWKL